MDNPRVLLAIALSFLVLLIWQAWMQDYGPRSQPQPQEQQAAEDDTAAQATAPEDLPSAPADGLPPAATEEDVVVGTADGQLVEVTTDVYHAVIDTRGGVLQKVDLLQYPKQHPRDPEPFHLLKQEADQLFVAQSGLRAGSEPEPTHHASYRVDQTRYALEANADVLEVPLHWSNGNGVEVTKIYRFRRGSYVVELEHRISNQGNDDWSARPYRQLQRTPPQQTSRILYTYTGGVLYSPEEKYEKIDFGDMTDQDLSRDVANGWAAMIQHYFVAAWIPEADATLRYYTRALSGERYVIGMIGQPVTVPSGGEASTAARLFVGPKLQEEMEAVAPGLKLTVDYGKLTILAQPIYWLLDKIHNVVGNWGWAIILLTVLIKAAFFKLSETSYKSMANMRKLAPRLQALKERYGDDKQKLNQAMMEMYKTEKVNPLGGCLPILVQIPVFIALYWVLLESVELRQAPFMLWINDLSAKDPFYVLPLIMGVTMFIQQKLNPAPLDPIQAKVMMVLPVVFTVFFAFFPAGLVLYWVVNNTLSIAQQWVITRRVERAA